jgi:hypothetical protein
MLLEWHDEALRKRRHPIFAAFAITNHNLALGKIDILDAQPHALHQAQSTAIEQLGHELMDTAERVQHPSNLVARQHGREMFGLLGAHSLDGTLERLLEYLCVQEQQHAQRLILGGGGDMLFYRQVGQKSFDLRQPKIARVALAVEQHIAFDPADIGFFGTERIMFTAQDGTNLIEQAGRMGAHS